MSQGAMRFDVFGYIVEVERKGDEWHAYRVGTDGKRRSAPGTTIPPWIEPDQVARFLADLYHEAASPERPEVIRLK